MQGINEPEWLLNVTHVRFFRWHVVDDYHRLSQSRLLQVLRAHIAAVYCSYVHARACVWLRVCVCVFGLRQSALGNKTKW